MCKHTIDYIGNVLDLLVKNFYEPELTLVFQDKKDNYMIIAYSNHYTFQRCGVNNRGSGEEKYDSYKSLIKNVNLDGLNLFVDWDKITDIYCDCCDLDESNERLPIVFKTH